MVSGLLVPAVVGIVAGQLALSVHRARAQLDDYFPVTIGPSTDGLALAEVPGWQIDVLLRVEDPDFWSHSGIDLSTPGGGITTITQALVKRTFMHPFRPGPWNKLEQSVIAWLVIDAEVPKPRQLEAFLNIAYFGERDGESIIGFDAAARRYFDMPVAALERRQFLVLVAMLIAPNDLQPGRHEGPLDDRVARIEALLDRRCTPDGLRDVWLKGCDGR